MTDTCQNIKDADLDHAIVNHLHPLCPKCKNFKYSPKI